MRKQKEPTYLNREKERKKDAYGDAKKTDKMDDPKYEAELEKKTLRLLPPIYEKDRKTKEFKIYQIFVQKTAKEKQNHYSNKGGKIYLVCW